jgi:protein-tyrosine phosphatase
MKKIIFICLGNICRSSLAEGVAKSRAKKLGLGLQIDSAGLSTVHNGEVPCEVSQNLAQLHGVDISKQISKHVSNFDLTAYDLVVAMDGSNKLELEKMGIKNIKKMGDFGFDGKDVADLYFEAHKVDEVWEIVSEGVDRILAL